MPWGGFFDVPSLRSETQRLEDEAAAPDFWNNNERANAHFQKIRQLKAQWVPWIELESLVGDMRELIGIVDEGDAASLSQLEKEIDEFSKKVDHLEFQKLLGGPNDRNNAILSINAGAGGTEACDWAAMLLRMYTRWSEDQGYKVEGLDVLAGEGAGIKNVTVFVRGDFAYGYLKSENGVHRLVRISPFDANKRRHTSFASVEVIPEVDDDIKIEIKEAEIRVDVFRSGGHGGQGVNTTDSAVRITHLPTGLVVQCQNERSQLKNKATAMKVLRSRLHEREMRARHDQQQKAYGEKQEIAWGSQIRSYVLHPYNMVKDHRTDHETGDATGVLEGHLTEFLEAYLRQQGADK